jgi:hypothetical protein
MGGNKSGNNFNVVVEKQHHWLCSLSQRMVERAWLRRLIQLDPAYLASIMPDAKHLLRRRLVSWGLVYHEYFSNCRLLRKELVNGIKQDLSAAVSRDGDGNLQSRL